MNAKKIIFVSFLIAFAIILGGYILMMFNVISSEIYYPVVVAKIVSLAGFAGGILSYNFGIMKKNSTFWVIVMGGMQIRLFLTLLSVIFCLKFLNFSQNIFIITFSIFYFYYLIIEIVYLTKFNVNLEA